MDSVDKKREKVFSWPNEETSPTELLYRIENSDLFDQVGLHIIKGGFNVNFRRSILVKSTKKEGKINKNDKDNDYSWYG